jgi:hypothetical protein
MEDVGLVERIYSSAEKFAAGSSSE